MTSIIATDAWRALAGYRNTTVSDTIADLFTADRDRFKTNSWELDGVLLDLSKNRIDDGAWDRLITLAEASGVAAARIVEDTEVAPTGVLSKIKFTTLPTNAA